jgi:beta-mannanase
VQDARLNGIEEVTAAHEMLHAAYDRLSTSERGRIDSLTSQAFAALADERIKQVIEQYRARDATVVPNELHSILGTEVRELPPELDQYYAKYFTDRSKVVEFSEHYEGEFTKRKAQVEAYDAQLATLKGEIDAAQKSLENQADDLQRERKRLDAQLAAGNYETYNAAVPGFNARVRAYNTAVTVAEAKIKQHNDIVKTRNAITVEEAELQKALDSRIQTQTTQ